MSAPSVCAVMITADRPQLAAKAIACFRKQTYPHKRLMILDTGGRWLRDQMELGPNISDYPLLRGNATIGHLRNWLNEASPGEGDIICHWDDDDWSHPLRIAEQVALLEKSGADVCGYSEMLFWRDRDLCLEQNGQLDGEAWIYTGTILGTSLCYRRALWQELPFPATSYGEDTDWLKLLQHRRKKICQCSGLGALKQEFIKVPYDLQTGKPDGYMHTVPGLLTSTGPCMIARIHRGNTSKAYAPAAMRAAPHHWRRTPEWDKYCLEQMESK